MGGGGLKSVIN